MAALLTKRVTSPGDKDSVVGNNRMTRDEAWAIVCEFVQSESLRRHMLGVETCMAAYAEKFGENQQEWRVTALLHDFDWEIHPAAPDHPIKGEPILAGRGVPDHIRRAILSHATYAGVSRDSLMERALFACDELSGFLTACSYVKPGKSLAEVDLASVKRKMKDKAFARAVNRDDIREGASELAVELDDHIQFCLSAMQAREREILPG